MGRRAPATPTAGGVAPMTVVLGIDPSLSATGLAVWRDDPAAHQGVHTTVTTLETSPDDPAELRWHQILTRIWPHIVPGQTCAVIEGPVDRPGRGATTQALAELRGPLRYGLWLRGVPFVQPRPTTVKGFAGNGSWGKETMLVAARSQLSTPVGYPRTFDEADALWCLAMGLYRAGHHVVDRTIKRDAHVEGVDWPMSWPSKMKGEHPR